MQLPTDKKIWDDFRNGENYALSHIYYQYVQKLFRYGKKFSNNDELIKDTIQELFFDLIRTRENLGSTDNISFYLFTSFRRKFARNVQKSKQLSDFTNEKVQELEIVYSVEQEIIDKENITQREKMLEAGLKELSSKQREILYYKYTCDFSYEQICEIMSLKYDSARKQVFRALKSLRKALGDKVSVVLFLGIFSRKKFFSKK